GSQHSRLIICRLSHALECGDKRVLAIALETLGYGADRHRLPRTLPVDRTWIAKKLALGAGTYMGDLRSPRLVGDESRRVQRHLGDRGDGSVDGFESGRLLAALRDDDLARHAF